MDWTKGHRWSWISELLHISSKSNIQLFGRVRGAENKAWDWGHGQMTESSGDIITEPEQ